MSSDAELFNANPNAFLEKKIKDYVVRSPDNRLEAFDNDAIFDEPLVGFADGYDAIFADYKKTIGDMHLTPPQALTAQMENDGKSFNESAPVGVISIIFPIAEKTRLGMRAETECTTVRWNHTRWLGQDLVRKTCYYLIDLLQKLGYNAVAPGLGKSFSFRRVEGKIASSWSERHIAYAAGMGTFGLSDAFISERGVAIRCGSVVCDVALATTPRIYDGEYANCLFFVDGSCRRCMERCPGGAIDEQGHDKNKCSATMRNANDLAEKLGRKSAMVGRYASCGLCMTKVPCEHMIPPRK
jgi:hypothetical protein